MHFISQLRYNPNTGRDEKYYRIKETFRDQLGRVRSRILLNVGFLSGLRPEDIRDIGFGLTYMSEHRGEQNLFGNPQSHYSAIVREHMDKYWNEMVESGAVDTVARVLRETEKESRRYIDTGTMKHTDARDMGAEWACMQAMQQLRLEGFLRKEGWSDSMVKAALSLLATRFEQELQKAKDAIGKKGGVKKYEKVVERIGRAKEKYPSIARYYTVDYIRSEQDPALMSDIKWKKALPEEIEQSSGRYFLRTNVPSLDEKTTWDYYNLIREIECTNRQLKTDLSLRPIFHQKDERSDAHLFLGLLAYWVVNTIRLQLKKGGINDYWTEIVRKLSTQKIVTTEAINALGEKQHIRICSEPTKDAAEIYKLLSYKYRPFKRKICSTQPDLAKNGSTETQGDTT